MVLDLAKNHRKLIEETIKANDRYYGNADLLEAFCSDVYKKSYLLLDSVTNIDNLKSYLEKVVDTSLSSVLRQYGRDDTPKARPDKSKIHIDILEDPDIKEKIVKETNIKPADLELANKINKENRRIYPLKEDKIVSLKIDNQYIRELGRDVFADIDDPKTEYQDATIKETVINRIMSIVYEAHSRNPEKGYFQIFYARHVRLKKQASIANELKITQGELSKRYYELIRMVKERLQM